MENNIDFKELWSKQAAPVPNKGDLLLKINRLKTSNLKKIIYTNTYLLTTSLFIIFIWIYFQPEFITTKIGIVLTILAMAIFLVVYNRSIPLYKKINDNQSNREYLKSLLAIKSKQQFLQNRMLSIYYAMLSLGISLYMYEYASRMTLFGAILTYVISFSWIAFCWFYIRPKQIRKEEEKIAPIINWLKEANKELNAE